MAILGSATYKLVTDNSRLNRGLTDAEKSSRESSKRIAGNFKKIGAGMLVAGAAMGFALFKVSKGALELEKQFAEVRTLLPKVGDEAFGALQKDVIALSNELGMAAQDVIPALYQAISAGVPTDNVIDFLRTSGKAAIGGVTDLTSAVDGISSVINAYADSNFTAANASDLMFTAVRLGKTTFDELSRSLFNAVPVAASLGVGFDQITASLAAMTAQGVPTKIATTGLRQLFVEMSKDGMELADVIQNRFGKSLSGLMDEGRDFTVVMNEIAASMPSDEFRNMFSSVEAMNAAMLLVGPGGELVADALAEMRNSAGATEKAFQVMADTAGFKLSRAINMMKNTFKVAFMTVLPAIEQLLSWVQSMVTSFTEWAERNPKLMRALVIGAVVVGALLLVIGGLLIAMSMIISLAPAMGVALSVAFGPIGLIITAVGLLVAAGILLWKNWDKIWQLIGQTVEDVVNFIIRAFNTLTTGYRKVLGGLGKAAGWVAGVLGKELPGGMKKFLDAVDAGIPEVNIFTKQLASSVEASGDLTDAMTAAKDSLENYTKPLSDVVRTSKALAEADQAQAAARDDLNDLIESGTASAKELADAQALWESATDRVTAAEREAKDALAQRGREQEKVAKEAQEIRETILEQIADYTDQRTEIESAGLKARRDAQEDHLDTLQDIQSSYDDDVEDAQEDHLEDLQDIQVSYDEDVEDTQERHLDTLSDIQASYDDDVQDAQEDHLDTLQGIQVSYDEDVEDTQERHLDELQGIQASYDDDVQDAQEDHLDTLQGIQVSYDDDVLQARRRADGKLVELLEDYHRDIESAGDSHAERLRDAAQKNSERTEDLDTSSARKREDILMRFNRSVEDLESTSGEARFEAIADLTERRDRALEDLATDHTRRSEDIATDTARKREEIQQDHNEELAELWDRHAEEEAQAVIDHNEKLTGLQEGREKDEAQAVIDHNEKLTGLHEEREEEEAQAVIEHGEKLAELQEGREKEEAQAVIDHGEKLAGLQEVREEDEAQAVIDHNEKLTGLQEGREKDEAQAVIDHNEKLTGLHEEREEEEAQAVIEHGEKLAELQAETDSELEKLEKDHGEKLEGIVVGKGARIEELEREHGRKVEGIVRSFGDRARIALKAALKVPAPKPRPLAFDELERVHGEANSSPVATPPPPPPPRAGEFFDIPYLDSGAVVTGPTIAGLAMNNRPEAVIPLDRAGGLGGGLTVKVYMDGATILEADDAEEYIVDMVDRAVRRGVVLGET